MSYLSYYSFRRLYRRRNAQFIWKALLLVSALIWLMPARLPPLDRDIPNVPLEAELPMRCDPLHCLPNVAHNWLVRGKPRQVISHRGIFGLWEGVYMHDGSLEAAKLAVEYAFRTIEFDVIVDRRGHMISAHEKGRDRISIGHGSWEDVDFEALPPAERRFAVRKVVDGALSDITTPLGTDIPSAWQYIEELTSIEPGMSFLVDARNEDSALAMCQLSRCPDLWANGNVWVQVYTHKFKNATEFILAVLACGPDSGWNHIPLVPSPHVTALHTLADRDIHDTDHDALASAAINFLNSFQGVGLNILGYDIAVRGGAKFYDPERKVVVHKELNQIFTTPDVVAWYAKDYALQTTLYEMKKRYPDLPILAPTQKYMVSVNGSMYRFSFETGQPVPINPTDPLDWLILNAGLAQTVFELGADWSMTDDTVATYKFLRYGIRQTGPDGYQHKSCNQDDFVFTGPDRIEL
ncbi:hypothetical protein F4808DRAFT_220300 [Astrocystis sublimbata]|nr:hypothetical protein F4808DRAFT_220300 [Astrocystis sublimbata]